MTNDYAHYGLWIIPCVRLLTRTRNTVVDVVVVDAGLVRVDGCVGVVEDGSSS